MATDKNAGIREVSESMHSFHSGYLRCWTVNKLILVSNWMYSSIVPEWRSRNSKSFQRIIIQATECVCANRKCWPGQLFIVYTCVNSHTHSVPCLPSYCGILFECIFIICIYNIDYLINSFSAPERAVQTFEKKKENDLLTFFLFRLAPIHSINSIGIYLFGLCNVYEVNTHIFVCIEGIWMHSLRHRRVPTILSSVERYVVGSTQTIQRFCV